MGFRPAKIGYVDRVIVHLPLQPARTVPTVDFICDPVRDASFPLRSIFAKHPWYPVLDAITFGKLLLLKIFWDTPPMYNQPGKIWRLRHYFNKVITQKML